MEGVHRSEVAGDGVNVLELDGVGIEGVYSCLPANSVDNLALCRELYGDETKAASVVKATGIRRKRIAEPGVTSLDLCVSAAEKLMEDASVRPEEIGGLVFVTFTPARNMPCNACQAQARLKLPKGIVAFDVGLACSGYAYGLYLAGMLVKATRKCVLLLDGDVQSAVMRQDDRDTAPVLADAGTATLVVPTSGGNPWAFAFMSDGADGDALTLPAGGAISMDGFAVYRFVATEVTRFIRAFMAKAGVSPDGVDAFAPHQANVFMVRQLAKSLGFAAEKLLVSGDEVGNPASASVPVTISRCAGSARNLLVAGFGGGLSASVARISLSDNVLLGSFDDR